MTTRARSAEVLEISRGAVTAALRHGAQAVSADTFRRREVAVRWRDGAVEQTTEATSRRLDMELYVDGRYSVASTSDLRQTPLEQFIADAIALARTLAPDPCRALPETALYLGQHDVDLQLEDPAYESLEPETRRRVSRELEDAARAEPGADRIVSVSTGFSDSWSENVKVTSNGFEGVRYGTSYWMSASVCVKDVDGRRPEGGSYAGVRFYGQLPDPREVASDAARRAHGRIGSKKMKSAVLPMALENRVAGRLLSALVGPLSASALQQKRSFLDGRLGHAIASTALTVVDDPLILRGFGSRLFDGEGIAARRLPLIEDGVLKNYYVDTYYGKKLGVAPTTRGPSNVTLPGGAGHEQSLLAAIHEGILVTGFRGGNTNSATGDFSLGVEGYRVRAGEVAEPIAEMNIAGNQLELWQRLLAVGGDPYPYSSYLTPTLVFEGVQFAGL